MTDKTEGLDVVAWQHVFADGRIVSYNEEQAGFPARDDALKVEPLVTLASAQAAVAAKQYNVDTWYERFVESEKRITDLERVNQGLLKCLKWYVEEDDVDNRESNKFWLEGKARAEAAIAAAEKEAAVKDSLTTGGLEVVAYLYQHEETGRTGFVDQTQIRCGWEQGNPRLKVIAPLVTLASAQAAVAAETERSDRLEEINEQMAEKLVRKGFELKASEARITALENSLMNAGMIIERLTNRLNQQ